MSDNEACVNTVIKAKVGVWKTSQTTNDGWGSVMAEENKIPHNPP